MGINGRLQTGSYEGQDGKRVYYTNVVADSAQFLDKKQQGAANQQQQGYNQSPNY